MKLFIITCMFIEIILHSCTIINFNEKNEKLYLIKINYIHIRRKLIKYIIKYNIIKFFIHKYGKCFSFINLFISFFLAVFLINNRQQNLYIHIFHKEFIYIYLTN